MLRLAVGAATRRLWLSYPRLDVSGARPRVPSFYMLDVMRAITGRIPNHEELQRHAAVAGGAKLDWPAPADASDAIDEVEHDLSTLRELIGHRDRPRGPRARALPARTQRRAAPFGGPPLGAGAVALAHAGRAGRARRRASSRCSPRSAWARVRYSVSALQKFTLCPYQFALSAIYRLQPNQEPEPLQRLDPLTKGSIFHEAQALFFRAMRDSGRLPVSAAGVNAALAVLDDVLEPGRGQVRRDARSGDPAGVV